MNPTDYRALVDQADVVYFPEERAASAAKAEPAALLLEAVQQSGKPFAVAWDLIDATQQPSLDELQLDGAPREEIIRRLDLAGTSRAREHCRSVLRELRARSVALRLPQTIIEKLGSGGALTPDEQRWIPTGFNAPPEGFDGYAEGLGSHGMNERTTAASYRAELTRRQFAADTIVRYFRVGGSDTKLIVFANSADFADGKGVPFYVAQKLNVRQLVLGRESPQGNSGRLLAGIVGDRRLEIVDRTPRSARD